MQYFFPTFMHIYYLFCVSLFDNIVDFDSLNQTFFILDFVFMHE